MLRRIYKDIRFELILRFILAFDLKDLFEVFSFPCKRTSRVQRVNNYNRVVGRIPFRDTISQLSNDFCKVPVFDLR